MWILGMFITIACCKTITGIIEKQFHITTPGTYQTIPLSDFCIKPSDQQTMTFDVKAPYDAIINLATTAGITSTFYEIVIGGNNNAAGMIRRTTPISAGTKVYLSIDNLLNYTEYRQFWISWIGGHIIVGHGHVPNLDGTAFINWRDTNPLSISSLYLKSAIPVEFIVHDTYENPSFFTKLSGQYVGSDVLQTSTVKSKTECAIKCHEHINCNSFNFKRSIDMCVLVKGRKTDIQVNTEYDLYSECFTP